MRICVNPVLAYSFTDTTLLFVNCYVFYGLGFYASDGYLVVVLLLSLLLSILLLSCVIGVNVVIEIVIIVKNKNPMGEGEMKDNLIKSHDEKNNVHMAQRTSQPAQ